MAHTGVRDFFAGVRDFFLVGALSVLHCFSACRANGSERPILNSPMPPKKGAGKPKGKKGKKGQQQTGDEQFQQYLDELFYIAPQARDGQRLANVKRIKAAYGSFQADRDAPVPIDDLGDVVRTLGLNPTVAQEKILKPMVEDADTGTCIVYDKLEKVLLTVLATKELTYSVTTPEGERQSKTELIYKEPERVVMEAFDAVWEATGKAMDPDMVRYIESAKLRELLETKGPIGEQFEEKQAGLFKDTFEDHATGHVREDTFAVFSLGDAA